ncbi:ABC transporter ATP-binding protein [Ferrimonas aestuarii]|uniref:ABC transporter ATP-binding protein n=1 Tax=Ferrimonas aestuarii TaxID=2569539 RepID=A0A4V5NXS5_9GAMM|nr:ABC transporter ATP-binding protein [Ferrimonas aestuarii]TKB53668.1 ABC transporter ATP-binding protein [Ferrimonas aestuarii]
MKVNIKKYLTTFYLSIHLVWQSSAYIAIALTFISIASGVLPLAMVYVGKEIIDVVTYGEVIQAQKESLYILVLIEGVLAILTAGLIRVDTYVKSILKALLSRDVNVRILNKSISLSLLQIEDSEVKNSMNRARSEASLRPIGLVEKSFETIKVFITILGSLILFLPYSLWIPGFIILSTIPSFIIDSKFSSEGFRIFNWRSEENRLQMYLESLLSTEQSVKEVKATGVGKSLIQKYVDVFNSLFVEDKKLLERQVRWGLAMTLLSSVCLYGAYIIICLDGVEQAITVGSLMMYLVLIKQLVGAMSQFLSHLGGLYEDTLYLSNLFDFLSIKSAMDGGKVKEGAVAGEGVRFENVTFQYPNAKTPAVENVSFQLEPGKSLAIIGDNGAGKSTLIKLALGLYKPTSGTIYFDGTNLNDWDFDALILKFGVVFQDFIRYQLTVGENISFGDINQKSNKKHWENSALVTKANQFIDNLPDRYDTRLGKLFSDGVDISGGEWQKIALSRALVNQDKSIYILDEPTASLDAYSEYEMFTTLKHTLADKMIIIISHRMSTARSADSILVMSSGKVIECGSHSELMKNRGRYRDLFELQANSYAS